ncbi:polysaccharide deacetylase [Rhizobium sp. Root1203]|uniref:polysaccharide deacetylase family protein n=1 Tax=Rhizobium sp. Root1203 TaxID=1736427 RepID=UPI00070D51C7|nr:polysaccharide deacetylase family protein [Rhizobium sp. Root1203]KQV30818.1 polysaccharide deacetylase [Rhizobium sp. Root1203]
MTPDQAWMPLRAELERWRAAGRTARLWFRDDDAVEPTDALDRLLKLTRDARVPLTLAVIPASTGNALVDRLSREQHVAVALHGWSHTNHAAADEKKQELGGHRPAAIVLGELRDGYGKLERLYRQQFIPMLVPPWNRIDQALVAELPLLGLNALSVYGREKPGGAIRLLNTHVDIMNWHGTRGGRPAAELVAALVAELQSRPEGDLEPIGILAHHLVHDATAWNFLSRLMEETHDHPAVAWTAAPILLQA